jgi:hypothetical protein
MKYARIILLILLLSCSSSNPVSQSSANTDWSATPTNKTTKIKVVTNSYGGYAGLHAHSIDLLTHLNFDIDNNTNPITTLPKILFGRLVKYYIDCDTTAIIIHGEMMESALGGLSNVSASDFSGKPIVKGSGSTGTAWFEKMLVVAEATQGGTIYYSSE